MQIRIRAIYTRFQSLEIYCDQWDKCASVWRRNIRSERKEVAVLILQVARRVSGIKRLQNIGFRLTRAGIRRSNPRNAVISDI